MSPATIQSAQEILGTLANAAARSIILGSILAALVAMGRPKNVRVKLFAWRALLCAALAMPILVALGPTVRISVPLPQLAGKTSLASAIPGSASQDVMDRASTAAPGAPDNSTFFAAPSRSDDVGVGIARRGDAPVRLALAPEASTGTSPAVMSSVPAPTSTVRRPISWTIPWTLIALAIYAAIAIALIARVLIGIAFSSRLVRASKPVEDHAALDLLASAALALGLAQIPRLAESQNISVPVVIGVSDPAVLLPADDRVWEEDELAAVLLHEVSHVARHDALLQRLALIHRAIFWFSPLAWWLERHMADLAEQASDEAALAGGVDRTRYAESLLGFFADLEAVPERVWWQGVSMAKTGQAEKRVDRILSWRGAMSNSISGGRKKFAVIGLMALAVPLVALTAAVRVSAYDIQTPPVPPAPVAPPAAPAAAAPAAPAAPQAPAQAAEPAEPADQNVIAQPDAEPGSPDVHVLGPLKELRVYVPPVNVDVPEIHVEGPLLHLEVPPVHVAVPQIHLETRMIMSQDGANADPLVMLSDGDWNSGGWYGYYVGRYDDWRPRFAIVTRDSDALIMSGDREDAEHARSLKQKYSGDFIWFKHDDKPYVVSDPATLARAKQLWQPAEDLSKQMKDLGKQMQDLGKQMQDSHDKAQDAKIKIPDLSAEMQKLEENVKQLSANGGTYHDIGELQRQVGELQREIGQAESSAGPDMGTWGREQGELGRKMGDLGRQQGELGRKQGEQSREAAREMQKLLDDAVAKGLAKPE
jgi:beta-lactamase regulating signal transducer with metallopeptidase domain